jgi:hypothetical protein
MGSELLVGVFRFDLQLLLAGLADPVMLAFNEGMVVDAFAVVFSAQITLHEDEVYRSS